VAAALRDAGWTVAATNWRGGGHELDLVAERNGTLRFVEVKARAGSDLDDGLDAVDDDKVRRLTAAAEAWMQGSSRSWDDVAFLLVLARPDEGGFALRWIDDAFDAAR
jgi:putative endonuclease